VVAGSIACVGYDAGGYSLESRNTYAIIAWWILVVAVGLGLSRYDRLPARTRLTGLILFLFTVTTGASAAWASDPEAALDSFNRTALYLAIFLITAMFVTRTTAVALADGLAIGIAVICGGALVSRLFPGTVSAGSIETFLSSAQARLNYPLGYWNALGALIALGLPLLFRSASMAVSRWARAAAVGAVPAFACAIFLTSSRGAVITAVIGTLTFLALSRGMRWRILGVIACSLLGSVSAVAVIDARPALLNGPLTSVAASTQGKSAALLLALVCVATGAIYAFLDLHQPRVRVSDSVGWLMSASLVLTAAVAVLLSHPLAKVHSFTRPQVSTFAQSPISGHLVNTSGTGRWQLWGAAISEFKAAPVAGRGAGSYGSWWLRHMTAPFYTRYAHSLYLQTLAELGLIGAVLLVTAFAFALWSGFRTLPQNEPIDRAVHAAALSVFIAFAAVSAIDWIWEVPAVTLVGFIALGVVARAPGADRPRPVSSGGRAGGFAPAVWRVGFLGVGWVIICLEVIPLLSQLKLGESQAAAQRGQAVAALTSAVSARRVEPWAASPYVQIALVEEQIGELTAAQKSIEAALARSPEDWRLWVIAARIETSAADIPAARRSLSRIRDLNPGLLSKS
jgi:hypothetical protein